MLLNITIEERVALLEIQVADLDQDVNFLFDETVIQDEKLLNLEQETEEIDEQLVVINDELQSKFVQFIFVSTVFCCSFPLIILIFLYEIGNINVELLLNIFFIYTIDLQDTTLALDFRVAVLEENGGDDGNSSVAELEVRVETLEGTAANHETKISAAEVDINGN